MKISEVRKEFWKESVTAITAAFAFLIALSWRTPIQNTVNKIIENFGLVGDRLLVEYLAAIVVTIIAVLGLVVFSFFKAKD
jgi:phage-related protein